MVRFMFAQYTRPPEFPGKLDAVRYRENHYALS